MSVGTPAGWSDLDAQAPEVGDAVAAAELVLGRRFGATIRLAHPELMRDPDQGDRSIVVRVKVADSPFGLPRSLVIKQSLGRPADNAESFAHQAASSLLLTALAGRDRHSPQLLAHDLTRQVLVFEDLGWAPSLARTLLADDPRAAERGLLSWSRALGRTHAATASREGDFTALMRRAGSRVWRDRATVGAREALTSLPDLVEAGLGVPTPSGLADEVSSGVNLLGGSRYRALSVIGRCPDRSLLSGKGVRFVDFAFGCVRDIALDAAYLVVPFPSCWCSFGLPRGMAEAMLAAWRCEIAPIWPEMDEDDVLYPRLARAVLLWVWQSTMVALPALMDDAHRPADHHLLSPPRATLLSARWRRLAEQAGRAAMPVVAAHADTVAHAIGERFGSSTTLPLYPAFR